MNHWHSRCNAWCTGDVHAVECFSIREHLTLEQAQADANRYYAGWPGAFEVLSVRQAAEADRATWIAVRRAEHLPEVPLSAHYLYIVFMRHKEPHNATRPPHDHP